MDVNDDVNVTAPPSADGENKGGDDGDDDSANNNSDDDDNNESDDSSSDGGSGGDSDDNADSLQWAACLLDCDFVVSTCLKNHCLMIVQRKDIQQMSIESKQ